MARVDQLTSEVLETATEQGRARAKWVRAFAYARFMLDYRSQRYLDAFEANVGDLRVEAPELLKEELDRLSMTMLYYVPSMPTTEKEVRGCHERGLLYIAERETSHPIGAEHRAFLQGINHLMAGRMLTELGKDGASHFGDAERLLQDASEKQPTNYEYAVHRVFRLQQMKDLEKAGEAVRKLATTFPTKDWSFYEFHGTWSLADDFETTEAASDPYTILHRLKRDVAANKDPDKVYPQLQGVHASINAAQLEAGWPALRAVAGYYYFSMATLSGAGHYKSAEHAATILQEISPDYAAVHSHLGVIYQGLAKQAEAEGEPGEHYHKKSLEELQTQTNLNYLGTAANEARRFLAEYAGSQ